MLTFPQQLERIRQALCAQESALQAVASCYADAIAAGGLVHLYANGHSLMTVCETVVRMGALTGSLGRRAHPVCRCGGFERDPGQPTFRKVREHRRQAAG
ncbi:MAG: SIS domain-containing protein [Betaproteobacteria bacterium]|nr:SIS domain-containing protein [Betaproteobacteria bacterium]